MVRFLFTFGLVGAVTALLIPDFLVQPVCLAKAAMDAAPAACPPAEIGATARHAAREARQMAGLTA